MTTVLSKIEETILRHEVNWKTFLSIVTVVHVCYDTGAKNMKLLINSLLGRAVERSQNDLLLVAFLLARHIMCENNLANYGLWFTTYVTMSATTPKHFAAIMRFLANIVRYEPAAVLRAHLSNPPHIPMTVTN